MKLGPFTTSVIGLVSGALFVAVGLLFLLTDATSALGGILGATEQYRVENWLRGVGEAIPDFVMLALAAVVVGLIAWRWLSRPKGDEGSG
ncbi:hypothetical protein [Tessaracoccus aquimaris]|uniref:hypothetical protein n=1 Tax=Tessaracoccus aquimaris TaxID=1332264 RepID=UPI001D05C0ED|nr:hypothetical protein [Tessaracoccus aquimaris]